MWLKGFRECHVSFQSYRGQMTSTCKNFRSCFLASLCLLFSGGAGSPVPYPSLLLGRQLSVVMLSSYLLPSGNSGVSIWSGLTWSLTSLPPHRVLIAMLWGVFFASLWWSPILLGYIIFSLLLSMCIIFSLGILYFFILVLSLNF